MLCDTNLNLDMPEVRRCCFMFPLKHGSYLIALIGLAMGGTGLVGVILYGLVDKSIAGNTNSVDASVKKLAIMTFGVTSLLLIIANTILLLAVTKCKRHGMASAAKGVLLIMCFFLLVGCIMIPLLCFFFQRTCIIKKMSTPVTVLLYLWLGIFISTWIYFVIVINSFEPRS